MKIGIDARLINETGVGRYIRNLIAELGNIDRQNSYVVFLKREAFDSFVVPNNRWQKRLAEVPWHSVAEQFVMPWLLVKEHLDLVHIPYFNVPIFYPGKFIVTIHDLTILHFDTGKATTLPMPLYQLRRLGYYLVLAVGLRRAAKVITVSHTTKHEIIDHFQIEPDKIVVTYEGVDEKVKSQKSPARPPGRAKVKSQKRIIENPYFLYVGNAYPHKNLEMLLKGFAQLISQGTSLRGKEVPFKTKLVIVGKDDFFYQRLRKTVKAMGLSDSVLFFGPASDDQLRRLYTQAIALVFPSRMEGFGLPGLEAMACGCPVVCSDIPVFHEIYSDAAVFTNPYNANDIASHLVTIAKDQKFQHKIRTKGAMNVQKYSWPTLAKKTMMTYRTSMSYV